MLQLFGRQSFEQSRVELMLMENPDSITRLALCPWEIFHALLSSADYFPNHLFRKILSLSNRLDPDQARHFVGPDLGPNCLQKLSADDTRR